MENERRHYDAAFKDEALRLLGTSAKSVAELARDLGIHPSLLWKWRRKARERAGRPAAEVFPGNGKRASAEEEVERLRRELEQVKLERDFLKKAAAYFAKESR